MKSKYIVFCGVDGAGKTSIINRLRNQLNATYIKEPTKEIEAAPVFKKISLFAQDREEQFRDIKFPLTRHLISDRSYICSLVYQSIEIEKEYGWSTYQSINYVLEQQPETPRPDIVIFIHASTSVIIKRLMSRNEERLTFDQINEIQNRYSLVFKLYNFNTLSIDTTRHSINSSVNNILNHIGVS